MAFTLPNLPYDFAALEPHIDAKTMEIHHGKHHAAYVEKLNAALKDTEWSAKTIEEIITNLDSIPETVRTAVRNNGGGHYNHSLFWTMMSASGGDEPTGVLADDITKTFGSFAKFQELFAAAAAGRFGSGWVWLVRKSDNTLAIMDTPNQDNPRMTDASLSILLGLDVWEHAYYLNYQNRRPDYVTAFWNVVNWDKVAELASAK